jgi:hypothetical protein
MPKPTGPTVTFTWLPFSGGGEDIVPSSETMYLVALPHREPPPGFRHAPFILMSGSALTEPGFWGDYIEWYVPLKDLSPYREDGS